MQRLNNWKLNIGSIGNSRQRAGFSLIELLVVMAVLGVLGAVLITAINPLTQLQKTRDAQRKSDLAQIKRALDLYYSDNGSYPAASGGLIAGVAWGTNWTSYMNPLPKDPTTGKNYSYVSTGATYGLYTSLERATTDPQRCGAGTLCPNLASSGSCGSSPCNYGVASSNTNP